MRTIIFLRFLIIAFLLNFTFYTSQVSNYTFFESAGTYSPITSGTIAHSSGWDNGITSISFPIGFTFNFNGTNYTGCNISTNGFITFGATAPTSTNYIPISSTEAYSGAISAIGFDLISNASTIEYTTIGTAPNRTFVVQYNNARRYSGSTINGDFNFQIRLNETSNVIDVVYGNCTPQTNNNYGVQVGLRGSNNADFNNRSLGSNFIWDNTTAGGANNAATCRTRSNAYPNSGRTFTWAPPCSGTPSGGATSLSPTTGSPSSTFTATVSGVPNNSGYTYQWQWSYDNSTWNNLTTNTSDPTFCTNPTGATTTITAVSTFPTTVYYRRAITCTNSSSTSYSNSIAFITKCDNPTTSQPVKLYIEKFKYVGVLNDVPVENIQTSLIPYSNGYQDYTSLPIVAEQVQGSVVNVDVVCGGTITSPAKGRWLAWVDWNKDGVFSTSEEVYKMGGYKTESVTFGFIISPTRNPGDYKLRIAVINDNSSTSINTCNLSMIGEVEDYLFRVIEDNQAKLDTSKQNVFSRCDPGIVPMTVYGKDANAVNFKWYDVKYGGTSLFTGSTYSPNITSTKTFYVTAVDANGKETPFRYPIIARIDPVPEVTFTRTPETICGEDDPYLKLSVWGDKREEILIDEEFNSNLGVFSIGKEDSFIDNYNATKYVPDWRLAPSTPYLPPNPPHLAIKSSIASGYFGGNFAIVNTDVIRYVPIKRYMVSTSDYDINGFIKNTLKLDFDLYYFSNTANINNGYFSVEYSLDGTNWTSIANYVKEKGNPLNWERISLDLHDLGVPETSPSKLKIRFLIYSNGTGTNYTKFEYFESIATVDNVKLYGFKPFERDFSWSGADAVVLYDKTCTTPLGNTLAREVCVKPSGAEYEKPSWTFYASATFNNGCPAVGSTTVYNDTKVWNQPSKTNWNQADDDWKPSGIPTIKKCVLVRTPVELLSGTAGKARSVIVEPGGTLAIRKDASLEVQNHVKNRTSNAADFLVESDANLKQNNDASENEGSITVKRDAKMKRLDYTYWGAPVTGQNLKAFSNGTLDNRFYVYREVDDYFDGVFAYSKSGAYDGSVMPDHFPLQDKNTYNFEITKGYAVRAPNNYTSTNTIFNGTFVGVPNNGIKNFVLKYTDAAHGNNFVANPYPSNIDFSKLYADNSTYMYNTAWFWTNVNPNPVMQGSNYPSQYLGVDYYNNYAIYNGSGGVGPTSTAPVNGSTSGPTSLIPTNIIKVGQGFVIRAKPAGKGQDLVFKNAIRSIDNSGKFFNARTANANSTSVDRYWLRLSTPLGVNNDILVAYKEGATNDYEIDYDAKMMANPPDAFYSVLNEDKLVIQGRKFPLNTNDAVTLGARFYQPGSYKVSILKKEGIFDNGQEIYLKDKLVGKLVNLQYEDYTFNVSAEGNITDRFEIVYRNNATLSTDNVNKQNVVVYKNEDHYTIESMDKITEIFLFDAAGKLINKFLPNANKAEVSSQNLSKGVYILKIKTSGKIISKKVIK